MAGIIINMSKIKQVLRLHAQGISNRKIAGDLGLYKGTVNTYVRKIKEHEYNIEELLAWMNRFWRVNFSPAIPLTSKIVSKSLRA